MGDAEGQTVLFGGVHSLPSFGRLVCLRVSPQQLHDPLERALHAWTSCLQLSAWGVSPPAQTQTGWESSTSHCPSKASALPSLTEPRVYSGKSRNLLFSRKVPLRSSTLMVFPDLFVASLEDGLMAKADSLIPLLSSCPSSVAERFRNCS